MDESGIEATQALDFGDYDDDDITDDELGENSPVAYLNVACQKGYPGKQFPVYEGDNVIGRDEECKISIPLKALSREHACIEVKGDSHFIYDKGSRNRTRRHKHFLAASVRYELKNKDKLIFGDVECEYRIGSRAADDGDDTGSESVFQTAPDDEELDHSVETNKKSKDKPPDEDDYASDASSDILEPTQPFAGNTQSMLGNRTRNGNSTLAQNITVKDTPAAPKTKRFTEDLVLPESDSDTDDERSTKPPSTLAIVADSQDDDDEDDRVKSRMMGAATQAYVCESDVTTDEEDSFANKKSLLAAPTQAFIEDDDVSTCSEDSPQKKSLLTAATQAFAADSDDEKTPSKRPAKVAPTVAYDMDVGIEPTQGYDMDDDDTDDKKKEKTPSKRPAKVGPTVAYEMDVGIEPTQGYDMDDDTDDEKEEKEEEQKSSGILFEPTQAYLGSKAPEDKDDVDDTKSDTSEEFVLEGDTDAEESDDAGEILAAPTLACDIPGGDEGETQVISTEEPTQVVGGKAEAEGDATVAVGEEATQVFDEPEPKRAGRNRKTKADETVPICEAETQVFQGNDEADSKSNVTNDDATQVFDDDTKGRKKPRKSAESDVAVTQVFDENATQVFESDHDTKSAPKHKRKSQQNAETQVFNDDATQCFDDEKDSKEVETQIFDEPTRVKTSKRAATSKHEEMATQVFDKKDGDAVTQVFSEDEGNTFDITAASTLAFNEEASEESETEEVDDAAGGDDATQVFDEASSTVAVNEDQTVPVESETKKRKSSRGRGKQSKVDETVPVTDDATQVFEDKPVQTKAARGRRKQAATTDDTVAVSDDATQVFDETAALGGDDQTVAVQEIESESKTGRRKKGKKTEPVATHNEDATQVFDETVAVSGEDQTIAIQEDQTVAVEEIESKWKSGSRRKGKETEHVAKQNNNEDATQVFDETVAVEDDQTVAVEEIENKSKPAGKRKGKKTDHVAKQNNSEDATQVFDETVAVEDNISDSNILKMDNKRKSKGKSKAEKADVNEDATQIFEENLDTSESGNKRQKRKSVKGKSTSGKETEDATQVFEEILQEEENKESKNKELKNIANVRTRKKVQEEPTQVIDDTVPVSEEINVNSEVTETENAECSKTEHSTEVATQVFGKDADSESEEMEVSVPVETKGKRTRGSKQMNNKNVKENEAKSKVNKKSETVESSDKSIEPASTNVRKSGRTRGKAAVPEKDEKIAEIVGKQSRTKGKIDHVEESKGTEQEGKGKKAGKGKKNVEPELEPATQIYADNESSDDIATQRYEEVEDDDPTPDINDVLMNEENNSVPVVEPEPSRGRSPLKSALASPRKKKSPSPKKVQFVSQSSESSLESGEPSRRSKRGKGAGKLEMETASVSEESKENKTGTKTAVVTQTKRQTRRKQVNTEENAEPETEVTNQVSEEKQMTPENSVEHETNKNKATKRQTREKNVNTENSLKTESDSKDMSELTERDSKNKAEVTVKSTRRGRKSVDTETNFKGGNNGRKTRTSLPAVLEESKPESSEKSGKTKDIECVDEKQSAIKSKGKGRKNIKGKGLQEEIEREEPEESEHDIGKSRRQKGIDSRDSKVAKQTSEIDRSNIRENSEKRTSRVTRTNLNTNKSEHLKETKSDTTNNNTEVSEETISSRSHRNSRRKVTDDVDDSKDDHAKKSKLDHVKAEGDKREPSPQTLSRTRTSKSKTTDGDFTETKHDLEKNDVKDKTKGKVGKGNKGKSDKNETTDSNFEHDVVKEEAETTDNKHMAKGKVGKGRKGKGDKNKTDISDLSGTKHDEVEVEAEQADIKHKSMAGKSSNGKGQKVESDTVEEKEKLKQIQEEVNESKGSTRSKRGRNNKAVSKEEKETSVENIHTNRSQTLKRKESASSSNDSQESDMGETPAKRQKKKNTDSSTPKTTGKQAATVSTPKGSSTKQLETTVANSPTLRRTTVEGSKPKVMFTGVVDEQGEKIVKELGGELVSSVTECTHLVTDQVRRTVKFLCCLSRGEPIVSPQWLVSSKASGFFLDPTPFLVKDDASERKYKFRLDQSIEKAKKDRLFRGFTFKITKSVKPEPQHMKEILKCAGAEEFVDKMPDRPDQILTVVISCPDDQAQCEPAYKCGIPVLTAEFVLTGILRQEVDYYSFKLKKSDDGNKRPAATSSQETAKKRKR